MVNVGSVDRGVRFLLGLALLVASFLPYFGADPANAGPWMWVALGAGIVLMGTAAFRFCPLYRLVGIRTCRV